MLFRPFTQPRSGTIAELFDVNYFGRPVAYCCISGVCCRSARTTICDTSSVVPGRTTASASRSNLVSTPKARSNQGAMTKGTTAETVDGMSLAKIDRIIDDLRYERFRWTPVRRVNIPKPNGGTRPLGIPTWTDKMLQDVIRMILEAFYEPQFSDRSHGFRPDRGCHTALSEVANTWTGVRWFVEGDIKGCFENIDHEVLLAVLGEKLHDNRFLRLLKYLLKAGYMEDWKYGRTLSGTPQGGVVSPILANICLDRLDKFVENVLIPAHTRGTKRSVNLTWNNLRRHAVKAKEER